MHWQLTGFWKNYGFVSPSPYGMTGGYHLPAALFQMLTAVEVYSVYAIGHQGPHEIMCLSDPALCGLWLEVQSPSLWFHEFHVGRNWPNWPWAPASTWRIILVEPPFCGLSHVYPPENSQLRKFRHCQIRVGRLVSSKKIRFFSGSNSSFARGFYGL